MSEKFNSNTFDFEEEFKIKKHFPTPSYSDWKTLALKELKGKPLESLFILLPEGIELKPLYLRKNIEENFFVGFPGFRDFVRGGRASSSVEYGWLTAQKIYARTPAELNSKLKKIKGDGLNTIAFEIGNKFSPNILTIEDLTTAFEDIDVKALPILIDANPNALPFFIFFLAYLEKTGVSLKDVKGGILSDPIGNSAHTGELSDRFEPLAFQIRETLNLHSRLRAIDISSIPYSNAGANAIEEIAVSLASMVEYVNYFGDKGFEPSDIINLTQFTLSIDSSFFKGIAKLRAFRILFNKITEAYNTNNPPFVRAVTSKFNFTKYDPYVNMLRTTTEAFSAAAGGADAIEILPFDILWGEPSELGKRIAKNVHLILKEEAHINQIIDPAGGSFFVELLTNELAEKSWGLFQEIQKQGGIISSLKNGFIQNLIEASAREEKEKFRKREKVLIGVNKYSNPKEKSSDYRKKAERGNHENENSGKEKFNEELLRLKKVFTENNPSFLRYSIELVNKGLRLSELENLLSLKNAFKVQCLNEFRLAEELENLRLTVEKIEERKSAIKVVLLLLNETLKLKSQVDFTRNFFEAVGFKIKMETSLEKTIETSPEAIVILGEDKEKIISTTKKLKERTSALVIFYSKKREEQSLADFVILPSVNAIEIYKTIIQKSEKKTQPNNEEA